MANAPTDDSLTPSAKPSSGTFLGHPIGLYVLFFTELWERFSFYGMKTLLVLYMLNKFMWTQEDASGLLGTYAMLAYGLPVVGGFIADRYLGARRAVILGGILLSAGHICMAFEPLPFFYTALALIIAGVGLLKPNVSTQVGSLYKPGDPRRDGAFTIFYMGINLGALIGPLLCDWLRLHYGYHYGFAAAGIGMILGLIVYVIGLRLLVEFRQDVPEEKPAERSGTRLAESRPEHPPHVVRDRVIVLLVVFAFIILFWTAFEQSPNAMLVWADKHTNLRLLSAEPPPVTLDEPAAAVEPGEQVKGFTAALGQAWQAVKDWCRDPKMGSGQTQSINPFFIITLAPVFAFFWVWLDRRKRQPSTPTKMTLGLALVVAAFAVMWPAAYRENGASSAPLGALPAGFDVDEEGFLYSREKGAGDECTYYGLHRLRYDAAAHTLRLNGVLPDLDRFRLLAHTAPENLVKEVEEFAPRTARRPSRKERVHQIWLAEFVTGLFENFDRFQELSRTDSTKCYGEISTLVQQATEQAETKVKEPWSLSTHLEHAPKELGPVEIRQGQGKDRKVVLRWDPEAKVLTAFDEIKERPRIEFLAAAAEPDFKNAVDRVYLDSSRFRVSIWWLIGFYLLLTTGELCLSPVGLSLVTKLAPPKHVGLFMGGWFLATAVAEKLAQVFGAMWGKMPPAEYFFIFVVMCGVGAVLMGLLVPALKRKMHGVI